MKSIKGEVRWGIVGCGDVCEVKSGPAFNKVPDSHLVAVMRRDLAKAEDYAHRHQVEKFYSDASALINDPSVNAIYIATPPAFHESYTSQALRAGKPVYVEKPVTVNAESCRRMAAASQNAAVKVSVAHYRRRLPLFLKVKSLIDEGAIGNVRLVKLSTLQPKISKIIKQTDDNWRVKPELSGGGLFHDLSPHQLDILYWIFGEPLQTTGYSYNLTKYYDAPDVTTLEGLFANNVLVHGIWCFNIAEGNEQDSCEILGDEGMMKFSFFRKSTIELTNRSGKQEFELDYPVNIQQPMIESVVKYFKGEGPNPCSLDDAVIVMKMIDSASKDLAKAV